MQQRLNKSPEVVAQSDLINKPAKLAVKARHPHYSEPILGFGVISATRKPQSPTDSFGLQEIPSPNDPSPQWKSSCILLSTPSHDPFNKAAPFTWAAGRPGRPPQPSNHLQQSTGNPRNPQWNLTIPVSTGRYHHGRKEHGNPPYTTKQLHRHTKNNQVFGEAHQRVYSYGGLAPSTCSPQESPPWPFLGEPIGRKKILILLTLPM